MLDISVVIPCFDANETLGLQLEALSRQVDPPAFEVIVVDNRSATPPDEIVAAWQGRLANLRLVRATEAQGISVARNVGVREARTDKIILCDADDAAGSTFVRAAFEGLEQADFVTGAVTLIEAAEFDQGLDHVWDMLGPGTDPYGPLDFTHSDLDPAYPIMMGGACALTRGAIFSLDGWDQAFFPGVEDNDFALRLVDAGYTLGKSWAMTLAERGRATNAAAFRRAYDGGLMHMKLCAAHDLWATSPHLHDPPWYVDLAKLPAVAVTMLVRPRGQRDVLGLAGRAGLRIGQAAGFWRYRVRRATVDPDCGVGLHRANATATPSEPSRARRWAHPPSPREGA